MRRGKEVGSEIEYPQTDLGALRDQVHAGDVVLIFGQNQNIEGVRIPVISQTCTVASIITDHKMEWDDAEIMVVVSSKSRDKVKRRKLFKRRLNHDISDLHQILRKYKNVLTNITEQPRRYFLGGGYYTFQEGVNLARSFNFSLQNVVLDDSIGPIIILPSGRAHRFKSGDVLLPPVNEIPRIAEQLGIK